MAGMQGGDPEGAHPPHQKIAAVIGVHGKDDIIAGYKEAFYNALTAAATTEEPPQEEHPTAVPPVKVCPTCGQEIA